MPLFPALTDPSSIPTGDMPGDKVHITDWHLAAAATLYPALREQLDPVLAAGRAVVAVYGGSGVGKSELGSLLGHALNADGIGAYILSGDNYPRRIPSVNDAERLRVFRHAGVRGLVDAGAYDASVRDALSSLQAAGTDADPAAAAEHPWLPTYLGAGSTALAAYLGTPNEIDFAEVNAIIAAFKGGADTMTLKRMGRTEADQWYDQVDVSGTRVLVIEWTHGNSDFVEGVDVPILLNSTPAQTLAHRRARARDGAVDSPFTTLVLGLEQAKLDAQAPKASLILSKEGELLTYDAYLQAMGRHLPRDGVMLNAYPDSLDGTLAGLAAFVQRPEVAGAFRSLYLLPSVFNSDLDRGFSVIDYGLNDLLAKPADLEALAAAGLDLKFDFILNHASVLSPQFQDILARGERSPYNDFFIDWNAFWAGHGEMTPEGYIQPRADLIEHMFFRKPGLPLLMVRLPDGSEKPFWNTFYQEVRYPRVDAQDLMAAGLQYASADELATRVNATIADGGRPGDADFTGFEAWRDAVVDLVESRRTYLGQMDLNIKSHLVWTFYADTLARLAGYGAEIVRLDAFAYAPKEPGEKNFLNDPGTWDLLDQVKALADRHGLKLLPEIHARYEEGIHETIAAKGFLTYDFFLPGLLIHAFETHSAERLLAWIGDIQAKGIKTVSMLGCHDGIPLLDLKGLLSDDEIESVIATVRGRGGYVKDLHGQKATYYQVNATYYSALGCDDASMLLARAIHLFMPGKPQVWYLDLFAGENNLAAVERAGSGGHKEINRTNLSADDLEAGLARPVVQRQIDLLRFRNTHPAFGWDAELTASGEGSVLTLEWSREGHTARLEADLATRAFRITADGTDLDSQG